jgi:hypothetical protein
MASVGMATATSSERAQQVNERIAVSRMVAAGRARTGARWFYWIAGLSLINSLVVISGGSLHFVVGLGITSVVDAASKRLANFGPTLDIVVNGFVLAVLVLFGVFASKAQKWAFLLGMLLYAVDAVLLVLFKDYLAAGFHAYALWAIYSGYVAARQIQTY